MVRYSDGKSVNFDVRLVPDRNYTFVVWADVVNNANPVDGDRINDDWHYDTSDLTNVTINPTTWVAMDETRDAFTHTKTINYNGNTAINLQLTRPFAKLRIKTTDMKALNDLDIVPTKATVTYSTPHYNAFNAVAGVVVENSKDLTKAHTEYVIASYDDNKYDESMVLFTDYFFAADEQEVFNFLLTVYDQNGVAEANVIKTNNFNTPIPARRNYLTTISGNILTDGNNVKVDVQDAFENAQNPTDEPYYIEIWDGKTIKVPAQNEAGNYVIERGSELAWMAAAVNGTLPVESRATSYANKTFVLNADIDLGGNEWTPIGVKANHFNGTFDGNGHTIKGLKITELHDGTNAQAALFGTISLTTTIKNVVIDDAYIKYPATGEDFYASAIAGTIYGSVTFENIVVKNSTITGNNKVGAIFAHDGSSNKITINNCHVDNCYIASEDLKDGGNVGGLIGLFQTGSTDACRISNSSVKNSTIIGINSSNSGKRANSEFIGGILSKDKTNLVLENCVVANNNFSETIDGTSPVTYSGEFDDKFIGGEREGVRKGVVVINGTRYEGANEPKNVTAEDGNWYESISEAIAAGNDEISLGEGTFTMPNTLSNGAVIEGNGEETVLNMQDKIYSNYNDVTFRNLTVNVGTGNYKGLQHSSDIAYENCVINGVLWLYAPSTFTNCTFNVEGDAYNVWTYGATKATFTKCAFNSDGKSILVYNEGAPATTVTFNECSFNSNGKSFEGKAAIEIDSSLLSDGKHIVNINNCEVNGFAAGSVSNSNIYNPKMGDKADIFVDGVQVWAAGYAPVANYPNIFAKDGNYYVFSVAGLQDLNKYFQVNAYGNNTWSIEYNIAADIDAAGFTWNNVWVNVGNNNNNGIVLNGNGHKISNLTINGGALLSGTPCGGNEGVKPGLVKDITMENVVVNGGTHDAAIFWGYCYTNVDFENVTVNGATIKGGSNVGALVSRTAIEIANGEVKVNFKNCVVKNSTLEANSTEADPTGASGFIGRAYGNTKLTFSNCSVENNTINNAEGLVGGAVYGYGVWANGGWAGLGACNSFTKFDGVTFTETSNIDETRNVTIGQNVTFTDNVTGNAVEGGYSVAGIELKGGVIDGNGKVLTVNNAWNTWDCAVAATGGTIKNVTVSGSMRGIFMPGASGDVFIDNVTLDNVIYTFNSDAGNKNYGVYISNSTLNGWTSYSNVHKEVVFTNCTFGEGNGYKFCRPYNDSRFVNCNFCEGYEIEPVNCNVVFVNCRVNGVLVTPANAVELLGEAASKLKFE